MAHGDVSAVLLDAGGVMLFPQPDAMLPPLLAAGVAPSPEVLRRAHYRAMSALDVPGSPAPDRDTWWRGYLLDYVAECGVAADRRAEVAAGMAAGIPGFGWTHVGAAVPDGLRAISGLGVPVGVVSNSDGSVEAELCRLGVCCTAASASRSAIPVGVVIDSEVVGVAKPEPEIFWIALRALGVKPGPGVLHVGDSLRYDVAGALAAGLRPVHLDPYGYCPAPAGHLHVTSLAEVAALARLALGKAGRRASSAGHYTTGLCAGPRCTFPRCATTRRTPGRPATACCFARAISGSCSRDTTPCCRWVSGSG